MGHRGGNGSGLKIRGRGLLPGARAAIRIPRRGLIRVSSEWLDPGATLRAERGKQARLRQSMIEQRGRICPELSDCVGGVEMRGSGRERGTVRRLGARAACEGSRMSSLKTSALMLLSAIGSYERYWSRDTVS